MRRFLLRRLLRIFPIYYLLLAVMAALLPASRLGWYALYLSNITDVVLPGSGVGPLGHTWSLCVEEHFYLLWPLVVAFTTNRTAVRVLVFGVIPVAVLGALATSLALPIEAANLAIERLSPFRFLTLACGALVAFAEPRLMADPRGLWRRGVTLVAAGIALLPPFWFVVLPLLWLQAAWWPLALGATVTRVHLTLFCTGTLMLCLVPAGSRRLPQRLLSAAPLRAIGRVSYGIYLYHLPIFHALLQPPSTASWSRVAQAVSLTFAAATLSYWLVERPILRYATRFRSRAPRTHQPA